MSVCVDVHTILFQVTKKQHKYFGKQLSLQTIITFLDKLIYINK